jgi:Omp85 superfamily domain
MAAMTLRIRPPLAPLAACLLGIAAPALAVNNFGPPPADVIPPQLARVPKLPSDKQMEADHARIGKIEIYIIQVFDLSTPGNNNWLYRLADRLHVPTRQAAVRAQLLFHPGDLYSRRILEETARNIRQNSNFLREPVIRPIAYHQGVVDIQVITHDVWTLQPGVNFSRTGGVNAFGFQVSDANFLGTGKYVSVGHSEDVDRRSTYMDWSDPNVAGTRWMDSAQFQANSDGTAWGVGASYPFFSLETPHAVGLDAGNDHSVVQRYRLGDLYDAYSNDWRTGDFFLGDALVINDLWTDRLTVGWRVDESEFNRSPYHELIAPLPDDRNLSYPFVRMQWTRNNYVTVDNLAMIARTEDVHLGLDASIGAGFAAPWLGADRHALILDSELSDSWQFGSLAHRQQLFLTGRLAGRAEYGRLDDAEATGYANYYFATSRNTRFYAAVTADIGHRLDGDHYFDLGGDTGLRGYPLRYQNGNQLALFTVEERLYTNWFPFRLFNVGGAVFYDMGRTWGSTLVPTPQLGLLKDFGVGLRLGNARSSFGSVIHIDLAVPLDRYTDINHVQFLVSTQQSY